MPRYTMAILVKNVLGVLNQITDELSRSKVNITSFAVSETKSAKNSRVTVTFEGDEASKPGIIAKLCVLPDVCSVKELRSEDSIAYELMLIKVKNDPGTRESIRIAADAFRAETVDYTTDSVIMRVAGDCKRIEAFITLMREYEILEICRTGVVSLERGIHTVEN